MTVTQVGWRFDEMRNAKSINVAIDTPRCQDFINLLLRSFILTFNKTYCIFKTIMKQNAAEPGFIMPAREWIKSVIERNKKSDNGFALDLEILILKSALYILSILENIVGRNLYIKQTTAENETANIDPAILTLAQNLINDGFLKYYYIQDDFPDEPKAITVSAQFGNLIDKSDSARPEYSSSGVSGVDFASYGKALMRCLGEAVERTCLGFYKKKDLIYASFKELGDTAVNPKIFVNFSPTQLKDEKFLRCRFDENSRFGWTWGESLITGKKILVPAQLVYVPYKYEDKEPLIRRPISTGAAAYTNREEALYRGVCETVERDAFIIHYLNKISPPIIDLENSQDKDLKKIHEEFKRYNLELYVLDVTTDIPIPTFVTLIIDRTGIGPAVSVSNKTDLNNKKAIIGSIEGCLKVRSWTRRELLKKPDLAQIQQNVKNMFSLIDRCLFWTPVKMIKNIEFFTKGKKEPFVASEAPPTSKERLQKALQYFLTNKLEVIAVDLAIPEAKKHGFHAFMVSIPKLQPLYLDEKYPYYGGERLYNVPVKLGYFQSPKTEAKLNQIIQPFA